MQHGATSAAPRTGRALVVDDDGRVREALSAILAADGDVAEVVGAAEADVPVPATGCGESFEVAVVDVRAPGDDAGIEIVALLSRTVPVVAVSVSGAMRNAAVAAGAVAFCDKDADTDALLEAVRAARSTRRRVTDRC